MKVSKRGEYGMRALCHLAERHGEGLIHIKRIAAEEEIPPKFLEGILLELKRAGYVTSRRGIEGGYALARPPKEILLGEVIRVLDGPLAPIASAAELRELMARNPRQVGFYAVLMDVRNAVSSILDKTSLAEVLRRNRLLRETGEGPLRRPPDPLSGGM
jgi:Rrf2 family protein